MVNLPNFPVVQVTSVIFRGFVRWSNKFSNLAKKRSCLSIWPKIIRRRSIDQRASTSSNKKDGVSDPLETLWWKLSTVSTRHTSVQTRCMANIRGIRNQNQDRCHQPNQKSRRQIRKFQKQMGEIKRFIKRLSKILSMKYKKRGCWIQTFSKENSPNLSLTKKCNEIIKVEMETKRFSLMKLDRNFCQNLTIWPTIRVWNRDIIDNRWIKHFKLMDVKRNTKCWKENKCKLFRKRKKLRTHFNLTRNDTKWFSVRQNLNLRSLPKLVASIQKSHNRLTQRNKTHKTCLARDLNRCKLHRPKPKHQTKRQLHQSIHS